MLDKKQVEKELDKLIDIRSDFLNFFDANIPKKSNEIEFDFTQAPQLDAQKVYEHFFKLDYQARKLRGYLVSQLGLSAN
ncbi:MAG: hypothetical protein IBX44_09425 [Sulfurospirillum sp.]|nr:hypothetical protein [Sulfurospirillum sp.]